MKSISFLAVMMMSVFIIKSSSTNAQTEAPMRVGLVSAYTYVDFPFRDINDKVHAEQFSKELLMETYKEVLETLPMRTDVVFVNIDSLHSLPAYRLLIDKLKYTNHITPADDQLYLSAHSSFKWQEVMDELPGLDALAVLDVKFGLADEYGMMLASSRVYAACYFSIISPKKVHLQAYLSENSKERAKIRNNRIDDPALIEDYMSDASKQVTNQISAVILKERLKR